MFKHSRIVSSENHNMRTSSVSCCTKRTLRLIWRSRSFKVILIGIGRNTERAVVERYNNVDLISVNYDDIATGKLQIRRFQPPQFGLTTDVRENTSSRLSTNRERKGTEKCDCRRIRRLSPLSRRFLRQSHFSATVWTGLY